MRGGTGSASFPRSDEARASRVPCPASVACSYRSPGDNSGSRRQVCGAAGPNHAWIYHCLGGKRACRLASTTAEQVTEMAVRFLIAHPEAQQSSASGIVAKALSDAFPCPPN